MRSILLAFVLILSMLATSALAKAPLFIADIDFAPYSMLVQGEPAGIDVDLISEAAKRADLTLDLKFRPWDELVKMVDDGTCDGAFSFFHSPDRERAAMFMDAVPVHYSDYVLFTKVGKEIPFTDYSDLTNKIIGRIAGTDLGKDFQTALDQKVVQLKEYPDLASALRGLLMGEIDAYAGNIDVTYYRLKAMGMTSSIVYLPKKIVEQKPAYMVMSRASKMEDKDRVVQGLERALDQMRKDGTYNKIARHYLLRF